MRIEEDIKLDFDDVLIKPKRSVAASRASVNLERSFRFPYSALTLDCVPLISANMDSTGSFAMAKAFEPFKALVALHKFYSVDQLKENWNTWNAFYTLGINSDGLDKLKEYMRVAGETPRLICVDVANGYTQQFVYFVEKVRDLCPYSVIMAGNVATPEMTQELIINGKADIVKIGIGPGSVCTTRLKTGVGYPQLSAIAECADVAHGLHAHICADGGCKNPGDVAKAFGAGADFVMLAGILAGTEECEGKWKYKHLSGEIHSYCEDDSVITTSGPPYRTRWPEGFKPGVGFSFDPVVVPHQPVITHNKELDGVVIKEPKKSSLSFHGMSSKEAMEEHSGGMADYKTAEGIEIEVPYKGPVSDVMKDILGGLRSACAYTGAESLKDLPKTCTFVRTNRIK